VAVSLRICIALSLLSGQGAFVQAEEPTGLLPGSPVVATLMRLPGRTLGGDQFWADEFVRSGWRIQRNAFSDHYRLLDTNNYRRALGTYEACRARFNELAEAEPVSPKSKQAVVLLHGLFRSRDCMIPLGDYLAEHGNYEIVNVSYPSTQADVRAHAASLAKVLDNLEGIEQVNFVAHSLGNLVVRDWLHEHYKSEAARFELGRFVMLGPPNNGAQFARSFKENRLFSIVTGPSGKQLGEGWEELARHLGTPCCEFGILAGSAAIPNPLVEGNDDGMVAVSETKLPGAADFRVLPYHHGHIRSSEVVGEMTLNFVQHGYFSSAEERTPLR
jgi:predicted alpha/beta hydrolase family esterase